MQKPTNGKAIEKRLIPVDEYEMLLKCKALLDTVDYDPYAEQHGQLRQLELDRNELMEAYNGR